MKPPLDVGKYPPWLFKQKIDTRYSKLLEQDEAEKKAVAELTGISTGEEFDLRVAEHRARQVEKEIGLDVGRQGKDIYNAGGKFMIEMNLHSAGMPLKSLM